MHVLILTVGILRSSKGILCQTSLRRRRRNKDLQPGILFDSLGDFMCLNKLLIILFISLGGGNQETDSLERFRL